MTLGDFTGISKSSISRIVEEVTNVIAGMSKTYIKMPEDQEEIENNYRKFFEINKFPTVIGTIDCTHVKISGQGGEIGEIFRNRKQFFSINVQSICGPDLKFLDIVARWPGRTHDGHIFNMSRIKERFENREFGNSVLLGDGGYKLETYMMTPFRNPQTAEEMLYNRVQIHVRNTVERKYGVWKRRFPCLSFGLRCKISTSLKVIVACAVLHNFLIDRKDPEPFVDPSFEILLQQSIVTAQEDSDSCAQQTQNKNRQAVLRRQKFVEDINKN
jgi:nuclease HARBI1